MLVARLIEGRDFGVTLRAMGKLMEQLRRGYSGFNPSEAWTPAVNVYERDAAYVVCVDLAGIDRERLDIEVEKGRLCLRGYRDAPSVPGTTGAGERHLVHLMEIDHGPFYREIELPRDVDKDNISATYHNGLLWMELPKRP